MIKAEQIPDEVVEAMLKSIGSFFNREEARAACAAMLNAWPDAEWDRLYKGSAVQLILPLPEVANDQA
jgi:hypothetical protein